MYIHRVTDRLIERQDLLQLSSFLFGKGMSKRSILENRLEPGFFYVT